jgi:hypothetical protein
MPSTRSTGGVCSAPEDVWSLVRSASSGVSVEDLTRYVSQQIPVGSPLPMVRDPRVVFDTLFGVGATPGERRERRVEDKSLLDWLSSSVASLKKELGVRDRADVNAVDHEGNTAMHNRCSAWHSRLAGSRLPVTTTCTPSSAIR